jgi:hypothetical protein
MDPHAHIRSLPPKGEGFASPSGNYGAPPPFPRPRAGVTSHLPRLAGEDGWGRRQYPALARTALREA